MTNGIEGITTAALGLALDAASLRQRATASNISNATSVGYQPLTVSFESQLDDARLALSSQGRLDAASLSGVEPRAEPLPLTSGGLPPKVSLDTEVAEMTRNSVHYQALVKALSRHFSVLSTAVSDGKK